MLKLIKYVNNILSSIYWNFKIKKNFNLNGFRIKNVLQINNPDQILLGKNVNFGPGAIINCQSKKAHSLKIGDNCKIGRDIQINAYENVEIRKNVLISDRVHISDASHNFKENKPILNQGADFYGKVIIDEGAWIGINAVILPNVKVGKNSVVGANCVVNKNIPDDSIAVGVPARIIRK